MSFKLPSLQYSYDAMEPYFDKETMEIHYTKHHQSYINNVNIVLENLQEFANLSADELIQKLDAMPPDKKSIIRNNAGGHNNHCLFWKGLKQGTILHGKLKNAIENDFGTIDSFQEKFKNAAIAHFGSGWIWLVKKHNKLDIVSTNNQDNPLMGEAISGTYGYPILGLDVWEHAYYLKYQNRRIDYIKSFWNIVNWDEALNRFLQG